jgi:endogenous inhibitor of DNA gyrase (YacG/DUF329 family)
MLKAITCIYYLCDPDDVFTPRYIGKTTNPRKRLRDHIHKAKRQPTTKRDYWIRKLLRESKEPVLEIIGFIDHSESWQEVERKYIREAREIWGGKVTNLSDGGDGRTGSNPKLSGRNNPNFKERVDKECANCGTVMKVKPYQASGKYEKLYCSKKCHFEHRPTDSYPLWKGGRKVTIVCKHCAREVKDYISNNRSFCSKECADRYKSVEYEVTYLDGTTEVVDNLREWSTDKGLRYKTVLEAVRKNALCNKKFTIKRIL